MRKLHVDHQLRRYAGALRRRWRRMAARVPSTNPQLSDALERARVAEQEVEALTVALARVQGSGNADGSREPSELLGTNRQVGDLEPSFRYKLGERRRLSEYLRVDNDVREPVREVDLKMGGRAFAADHGVAVPALHAGPVNVELVDLDALPDHFVIKPIGGHSSRGVFLLHRVGEDRYASLLDRREIISSAQVLDRYREWMSKTTITRNVMVEQLLFDGASDKPRPPIDYRCFCFYGEVGFVMARDGNETRAGRSVRFRFFDASWTDLGVVRLDGIHDDSIPVPRHADRMIEIASKLSGAIPRPMVRIDLFDAVDDVYFGEVTPAPGGDLTFAGDYDGIFGRQWERAEARLEAEAINAGVRAVTRPEGG